MNTTRVCNGGAKQDACTTRSSAQICEMCTTQQCKHSFLLSPPFLSKSADTQREASQTPCFTVKPVTIPQPQSLHTLVHFRSCFVSGKSTKLKTVATISGSWERQVNFTQLSRKQASRNETNFPTNGWVVGHEYKHTLDPQHMTCNHKMFRFITFIPSLGFY